MFLEYFYFGGIMDILMVLWRDQTLFLGAVILIGMN